MGFVNVQLPGRPMAATPPGIPGTGRAPGGARNPAAAAGAGAMGSIEPDITYLYLFIRGVNLEKVTPDGNNKVAFAVAEGLKGQTNWVDASDSKLFGTLTVSDDKLTFKVGIMAKLARPLKF